jgi:hypothetical protein
MEKLINKTREMGTEQIRDLVAFIGGGQVSAEARMVRAALIEVFMEREGEEAADALMDSLGM